ncbi:class I SAM-dependent methyltransferase [Streptomyces sp. F63]|uniref:class I SAM-dependent methyltransferase n=1 Tax=Streptomyces sp. F63 TaxID=2824887 RepID=UPI001B36524D|nr:class I SAM-dependent methyltransferase [Streptomyces sp. F63]MBQ0983969.1 class I SAM-dependent methyltransferase [Streptomyces sp. F63]
MTAPLRLDDVKGWFPSLDQVLFAWFLTRQDRTGQRGDLLEMGAYLGKSAIFTGAFRRPEERFTVCDLFDTPAADEHNAAEARKSYASLTRAAFDTNYLAFHDELPDVVQAPTSVLPARITPGSCRFVHVDASHLYEHVAGDIETARKALAPGGVVVLDDFRSEHTPGVAAAAWEAVFNGGLRPVCLSTQKLYGTWDDPEPLQDELLAEMRRRGDTRISVQDVAGRRLLRFSGRPEAPRPVVSRFADRPSPGEAARPAGSPGHGGAAAPAPAAPAVSAARRAGRARRLAADVLPPVVTRAIRRRRRRGKP